ncbi:uncharacterized protein LOC27206511 [Drosophila simulans]|nr:uncharacterized protein LOC27206511 [Drosophila simulans]
MAIISQRHKPIHPLMNKTCQIFSINQMLGPILGTMSNQILIDCENWLEAESTLVHTCELESIGGVVAIKALDLAGKDYHSPSAATISNMRKSLLIVGSLLVTIFLAHLPVGLAVSCADDPTDTACVDCTDAANAAEADCVTTTAAPEATTAAAEATTAASADGETTTAAASGTDTTTASSGGKKRVKRTFKRKVRRPRKIRRRRSNRRRNNRRSQNSG